MVGQKLPMALILLLFVLTIPLSCCIQHESERGGGYFLLTAPKILSLGEKGSLSVVSRGEVSLEVLVKKDNREVLNKKVKVDGKKEIPLELVEPGEYLVIVKSRDFEGRDTIRVVDRPILIIETDKPIYKPGQDVKLRIISLGPMMNPLSKEIEISVFDSKNIKVFRKKARTDEFGFYELSFPLSEEPNLGRWRVEVKSGDSLSSVEFRVEKYSLPKFGISVELSKSWFLPDESIRGVVKAEYSFGRAVKGTLEIRAMRYVGKWEEYFRGKSEINGEAEFRVPPVKYTTGTFSGRGMGKVLLNFTVTEKDSGYSQSRTEIVEIPEKPVLVQIIPSDLSFKPGLPLKTLLITENPDNSPIDVELEVKARYYTEKGLREDKFSVKSKKGKAILSITPPEDCTYLEILAYIRGELYSKKEMFPYYSPSGSFIHIEQVSDGVPRIGEKVEFRIYSTSSGGTIFYEVINVWGRVLESGSTREVLKLKVTPEMYPEFKVVVYQITPSLEVAVDYLPVKVKGLEEILEVSFSKEEVEPREDVKLKIKTDGVAKVGLTLIDKSLVFLEESRLNLEQVLEELERVYMEPRYEVHFRSSKEVFSEAKVMVISNASIPSMPRPEIAVEGDFGVVKGVIMPLARERKMLESIEEAAMGLKEIELIREYFPETWFWGSVVSKGEKEIVLTAPDTITTWYLRAISTSEKGISIGESEIRVFRDFFLKVDVPYSVIRGEEFPIKVTIYNYSDRKERVLLDFNTNETWLDFLDDKRKWIEVDGNDLNSVSFRIRPKKIGLWRFTIFARGERHSDAVSKTLKVDPEGKPVEEVENYKLTSGDIIELDTKVPKHVVGSEKVYLRVTGAYMSQVIEGLDSLLKMPFGCGEQNMIFMAPDVYVTKYMKSSGDINPEILAKAEKFLITGYQRELTFMREDGSFSAFGERDDEGSLFLTAFVLRTFSEAKELIYIDENVLERAKNWIISKQSEEGYWEPIGFVHHKEILGGVSGRVPLTAYVVSSLLEYGYRTESGISYLKKIYPTLDDSYSIAIVSYALSLAGSSSDEVIDKLIEASRRDENGLHWGYEFENPAISIEATSYAALALINSGRFEDAKQAIDWILSKRNSNGGFFSTQDTVVAIKAITEFSLAAGAKGKEVEMEIEVLAEGRKIGEMKVDENNFDVLQEMSIPPDKRIKVVSKGKGEVFLQLVRKYNVLREEQSYEPIELDVEYSSEGIEETDQISILVRVKYVPKEGMPMETGMVVLDVSVPTGFKVVEDSLLNLPNKIKRYDLAGRKVIFYIDNLEAFEILSFSFKASALFPVKGKELYNKAYAYYNPEIWGEDFSSPP